MPAEQKFSKPGAQAADLTTAWQDRIADSQVLLNANRNAAAIASGVYAIEILLKVRICKILKLQQLPSAFEIHDLEGLATLAGLRSEIGEQAFRVSPIGQNWSAVIEDSRKLNDFRYLPGATWSNQEASLFFQRLQDPQDGVLPWIQTHA